MKLPRFDKKQYFSDLFDKMGAKYNKIKVVEEWTPIDKLLNVLISDGEVEISDDLKLHDFACADNFFRVRGKIVLAYIRDQQRHRREKNFDNGTTYKYHLINCEHLRTYAKRRLIDRYVLRRPNFLGKKGDATFNVNVIDRNEIIEKGLQEELLVCKFCLKETKFNGYDSIKNSASKDEFVQKFNYKEFFDSTEIIVKDLWSLNLGDEMSSNINIYPPNWRSISKKVRESQNYNCSKCKRSFKNHKEYLHVHHINGRKDDNSFRNLTPLCISCHSDEPGHEFMKVLHKKSIFNCNNIKN